jgi:hypothetical protein
LLDRQLTRTPLLLLTDVRAVQDGYGTPQARPQRPQRLLAGWPGTFVTR